MEEKLRFGLFFKKKKTIFVYQESSKREAIKGYLVSVKFQQQLLESTSGDESIPIPG